MYRLSRKCLLQLPFPRVFPTSIPLGLRMNQLIAWRSTGFSAAHYRDVGARWLAKYRGFKFYEDSDFFFLTLATRRMTIFLLSVTHFIFLTIFQLNILILARVIKEMRTLIQPTEEDNHTQQIREFLNLTFIR